MNKQLCQRCKRFEDNPNSKDSWYCAKEIRTYPSHVIQNFYVYEKDCFSPISIDREVPPEWCEFVTEQLLSTPDDVFPVEKAKRGYFKL